MKKFFIILLAMFLVLAIVVAVFAVYFFNYLKEEEVIKIESNKETTFSIEVREKEKGLLKKIVNKIKEVIYREATEHNPEGDLLPDEIDDRIKDEIKNRIK